MKKLYIMRHATANSPDGVASDFERPLTEHGKTEALQMSFRLKEDSVQLQKIMASSALRTQDTARTMADTLQLENIRCRKELYNAPYEVLLEHIKAVDASIDNLMVVAHNPGVSMLMSYFLGNYGDVPPATVIEIHFDVDSWGEIHRDVMVFDQIWTTLD